MSTIELVDPELRDALARWPAEPLNADNLTKRRADLLNVIGAVPMPDLPDIAAGEVRVDSARRKADPRSDLSPGRVRQPAARHRAHPWRRFRGGRTRDERCRE